MSTAVKAGPGRAVGSGVSDASGAAAGTISGANASAPAAAGGWSRHGALIGLAAGCGGLSILLPQGLTALAAASAGATILFLLAVSALMDWRAVQREQMAVRLDQARMDADPAAVVLTDMSGHILYRNPAAQERYGLTPGTMLSASLAGTFANPTTILMRLSATLGKTGAVTEDITTRQGSLRVSAFRIGMDDAAPVQWRFDALPDPAHHGRGADGLPVPQVTIGRNGAILFMNDAARLLAGGRLKTLKDLFVDLPVRAGEVNRIRGEDATQDVLVAEREVSAGRTELFLIPTSTPQSYQLGGIEALPVPVIKLSPDGRILSLNIHARSMIGGDASEGEALFDYMTGLGRPLSDWLRDVSTGRLVNHTEFLRLTRTDREMFVQVTLSRIAEEDGVAVVAVLHDATELKTLEAQFVQTQKMQAIGQLAGGVAHDFNNLLTAISGHCDLLLLRHDQGDLDYADLIQIRQNANRAAALVTQLLAFSRKQTLRPEVLDLRDTLADLTHLLNRLVGEKVTLTLIHDPVLRAVRADKRQLEQVLMNLVVNARDAMPAGGEIRIETEALELRESLHRDRASVPAGEYVLVRVTDQGVGIEPDKLQKVFEPFYTTKRTGEGTGLGLSTAYGIVKQTGGFIFVDSTLGEGTCFTLYLPVFDKEDLPEPEPIDPTPENLPPRQGEGVVLLVEDEAPVRAFASRALRLRGFTVLEAESGEDALQQLDDPSVVVDVFVTDVVMPGMDGPTWVRQALTARPDVRVVFVSGYAEGAFGDNGPEIPNSTFLPKPFSLSQLTETVNRQMC